MPRQHNQGAVLNRAGARRHLQTLATAYSPASLFAAAEPGFWAEVSPTNTWQDAARTLPSAVGDPVRSWGLSTAGAGTIYATASADAVRPILRQDGARYYLEFDGVDDQLITSAIDFTATDALTVGAGIRKASDAAIGYVIEGVIAPASFGLYGPAGASPSYGFLSRGTGIAVASVNAAPYAAPQTAVLVGLGKISTDQCVLRHNGAQVASVATDQGTGNFANQALYIGKRQNNSNPLNGRIYALVVLGRSVAAPELTSLETWINARTGAY